jgi:hypothetical protein
MDSPPEHSRNEPHVTQLGLVPGAAWAALAAITIARAVVTGTLIERLTILLVVDTSFPESRSIQSPRHPLDAATLRKTCINVLSEAGHRTSCGSLFRFDRRALSALSSWAPLRRVWQEGLD